MRNHILLSFLFALSLHFANCRILRLHKNLFREDPEQKVSALKIDKKETNIADHQKAQARQGGSQTHIHEHENAHKHRHKHNQTGRHIHRHEHIHNHQHNHDHGHKANHTQGHKHSHTGDHVHKHFKHISRNSNKSDKDYDNRRSGTVNGKHSSSRRQSIDGQTKDYHIKSVENYIGDSGKEFEGAAEQIVESYMGEYMQEYMQGWYGEYCEKTGQFCDQVKLKHATKDKKSDTEIVYNVKSSSGYTAEESMDQPVQIANAEDDNKLEDDVSISSMQSKNKKKEMKLRKTQKPKWKLEALKKRLEKKYYTDNFEGTRKPKITLDPKEFSYEFLHEKDINDFRKKVYKPQTDGYNYSPVEETVIDFIPAENGYQVIDDFMLE